MHDVAQLAVGEVLQAQVDRQRHGLAGLGVLGDLDVLDQAPAAVLEHLALARDTGQPLVIGQFHAFTTAIVDVGEADYVRCHFACRIEATELLLRVNAGNLQVENFLALLRRQAAHQVHEFARGLRLQPFAQHRCVLPERLGEFWPAGARGL